MDKKQPKIKQLLSIYVYFSQSHLCLLVNKNCSLHYDAQKQHDVIATITHKKRKTNISLHTTSLKTQFVHNLAKSVFESGPYGVVKIK